MSGEVNDSTNVTSGGNYTCSVQPYDLDSYGVVSFWLNGVAQLVVSLVGILGNSLSVPVLCSKQMISVFNRLLVCLAVFDNIHLLFTIMDSCR